MAGDHSAIQAAAEEEQSYRSELLLLTLQLLNHLATKDFLLDWDDTSPSPGGLGGMGGHSGHGHGHGQPNPLLTSSSFSSSSSSLTTTDSPVIFVGDLTTVVSTVLLQGLEALAPLLSADLLRCFPLAAERYFSFVLFVVNTYEEELAEKVRNDTSLSGQLVE